MKSLRLVATLAVAASMAAHAQTPRPADGPAPHRPSDAVSPSKLPAASQGEVRKVDKAAGKVTLKHGPLDNLRMPGMTMAFKVADPKMLDSLKEGDPVRFVAENVNGTLTVTAIEVAK